MTGVADDAVHGVRMAEALVRREFVKTEVETFAESVRQSTGPMLSMTQIIDRMRNVPPVGTPDNPYVVVVPQWYEFLCIERGTTPQEVYDRVFAESSWRHGRVEVVRPL